MVGNLSQILADAWERELRETPDIYWGLPWGEGQLTYRDLIDRQPKNCYGELIPRIVTVRRNLRRLKAGR